MARIQGAAPIQGAARVRAAARDGLQGAATGSLRRLNGLLGWRAGPLLPGLLPGVLLLKDPVELVFHPATQITETRALTAACPPAPTCSPGARSGAGHAIHQLPASGHQALKALLQGIGAATRPVSRTAD